MVSTYPSIPWINFNLSGLSSLCVQALQNQDLILANLKMLANQEQSKNVVWQYRPLTNLKGIQLLCFGQLVCTAMSIGAIISKLINYLAGVMG